MSVTTPENIIENDLVRKRVILKFMFNDLIGLSRGKHNIYLV